MKIAIVFGAFDPKRGGGQVWTAQLVEWLVRAGHELHVICERKGSDFSHPDVNVHLIARGSKTDYAKSIESKLEQIQPDITHDMACGWRSDVFHSHVGSPQAFYEAVLSVRPWWRRVGPLLLGSVLPRYREANALLKRQYSPERSTIYLALSRRIAEDYQVRHGIREDQIQLIPNGVDVHHFQPADQMTRRSLRQTMGFDENDIVCLQVAHNHVLKGVPELIQAAARLDVPGRRIQVVVVGGSRLNRSRRMARKIGFADNTHFVGKSDRMLDYYQMADVCVHATRYDACSLTILEAMACGLPVITTRQNGAAELIINGEQGFVLDSCNVDELLDNLHTLTDADVRREMGAEARQRMEHYSLEENFRQIHDLYQSILNQRRFAGAQHRRAA